MIRDGTGIVREHSGGEVTAAELRAQVGVAADLQSAGVRFDAEGKFSLEISHGQ